MNDHSSTSEQRIPIGGPRPAAEVGSALPAAFQPASAQVPAVGTGGVSLDKPKPYGSYEDLPQAVRSEFAELIASRDSFLGFFWNKVDNRATAEDLTGRMFEVLVRKLMDGKHDFRASQRQYAWGIARNLLAGHWRRVKTKVKATVEDEGKGGKADFDVTWVDAEVLTPDHADLDGDAAADEFEAFVDTEGIKGLFQHCAQTLTPYQITVFYLHTICELPYEEISQILDRTPNALRGCHKQALDKMRADVVGLADLLLATSHRGSGERETRKIPYAKRKAAARTRFGARK